MNQEETTEKQLQLKVLTQKNNFLESETGKELLKTLKRKIRLDLKSVLDVINEKEPDLKARFYLTSARLKANLEYYKDFTGVKSELKSLEDSIKEDEEDSVIG